MATALEVSNLPDTLEVSSLPDTLGVAALLEVLKSSQAPISLGRVCGGRVSAVWLGDDLSVVSCTLEPHELDNTDLCRTRGLEFLAEITEQSNLSLFSALLDQVAIR